MIKINEKTCTGCGLCREDCTRDVIEITAGKAAITERPCLSCWHCVAVCPTNSISCEECRDIQEYEKGAFELDPKTLLNFIKFRRSIRRYSSRKVENAKIDQVIEAGRFSPTGCNRQPLRYLVIDEEMEEIKFACMRVLKTLAEENAHSPAIPNDTVRTRFLHMEQEYQETGRDRLFFNAPQAMVLIADQSLGGRPLLDAGIAASNMELVAAALGLGICYIGFFVSAVENSADLRKRLGIRDHEIAAACFVFGYPAVQYYRTVGRKPAVIESR